MTPGLEHLFVYRPGALGDTLLALPALAVLRARLRPHRTTFVGYGPVAPLLTANRVADRVLSADDPALLPWFAGRPTELIDQIGRISSAVLWAGDPGGRLCQTLTETGAGAVTVARARPPEDQPTHVADHLLNTIGADAGYVSSGPLLTVPKAVDRQVRQRLGAPESRTILVVHPGSGSPRKNWPAGRFAEAMRRIRSNGNWFTAVVAGPADAEAVSALIDQLDRAPDIVAENWPLVELAALLAMADAYLGNDSGVSHLAGCLGASGLVLFGPTDPAVWAPLGGGLRALRREDMGAIDVDAVVDAITRLTCRRASRRR